MFCKKEISSHFIRLWVKPGGEGKRKCVRESKNWELGDHVIKLCCFDYKLKWMEVCSKFDGASSTFVRHCSS